MRKLLFVATVATAHLVALFGLAAAPLAQEAAGQAAPAEARVGSSRADTSQAEERIAQLLADTSLEEGERSRLVELYRAIIQRADLETAFAERAETLRQAISTAPAETAAIRAELSTKRANHAPDGPTQPPQGTSEELQQLRAQNQAQLATERARQSDLERRQTKEEALRNQDVSAEAREILAQIEAELASNPVLDADATEIERAERTLLLARQRARAAEITMLEQERISRPARIDLLAAQRDLVAWEVAALEARASRLDGWLGTRRQEEAERARQQAETLRRAALGKHQLISEMAAEIAEVTRATEELLPKIALATERGEETEAALTKLRADHDQAEEFLRVRITRALGTVLLEQRRALPTARSYRRAAARRESDVADARLQLFLLERDLAGPSDERVVDAALTEDATAGLSAPDVEALRAELLALAATLHESRKLHQDALLDYLAAVRDVESKENALITEAGELAALLDEQLLWIPDVSTLDLGTVRHLGTDLAWLLSPDSWTEVLDALLADARRLLWGWVLVGLGLVGLVVAHRRLGVPLQALASVVGKVADDSVRLTVKALAVQIVRSLPLPAAIAWCGWRCIAAFGTSRATKAIGGGLVTAAVVLFGFQLLRNLCRRHGVARAHFRWAEHTCVVLRRSLLGYLLVALPATFIIGLTEAQPDPLIRQGVGRLAFMVLMVSGAALAWVLLHPSRGVCVGRSLERASGSLQRTRPFWMPLGILLPLTLAGMAGTGYYYAALQLEYRVNQTLVIILGTILLHAFLLRWLLVSQRRLALRLATEKRAAQAKIDESGDAEEMAAGPTADALDTIDVVEVQGQTQDLLRVSMGFLLVVATWFAWVDVLPALAVFDTIELWSHEGMIEGVPQQVPITLANLGLALIGVLVTMTAARKMPGFLEIALLQRLPLEPGVRYATRTLALYAIVTVGVILSFNAIGVGWSSVQWLVAALTVGLGFGLQEIFANFVSGLIILLERPVRVGDTVTVGSTSGVVTRIRIRATTITDWRRRELLVPNKSFITGELINWSLSDPILRLDFMVGIAYGSDTTLAHSVMLRTCHENPLVLDHPESTVFFVGFGDNSLNFEVRVFVNEQSNTARTRILHELHMSIDRACRENGIEIAFPQRDLHFRSSDAVVRVALEPAPDAE